MWQISGEYRKCTQNISGEYRKCLWNRNHINWCGNIYRNWCAENWDEIANSERIFFTKLRFSRNLWTNSKDFELIPLSNQTLWTLYTPWKKGTFGGIFPIAHRAQIKGEGPLATGINANNSKASSTSTKKS